MTDVMLTFSQNGTIFTIVNSSLAKRPPRKGTRSMKHLCSLRPRSDAGKRNGFTLIELLDVIAIIAILAAIICCPGAV